jgi:hypothetical protein
VLSSYDDRTKNGITRAALRWHAVFDAPSYPKFFEPSETDTVITSMPITVERMEAFLLTISYIAILPDEEKEVVRKKIRNILANAQGVDWIDKSKGTFNANGRSMAISMRKKST